MDQEPEVVAHPPPVMSIPEIVDFEETMPESDDEGDIAYEEDFAPAYEEDIAPAVIAPAIIAPAYGEEDIAYGEEDIAYDDEDIAYDEEDIANDEGDFAYAEEEAALPVEPTVQPIETVQEIPYEPAVQQQWTSEDFAEPTSEDLAVPTTVAPPPAVSVPVYAVEAAMAVESTVTDQPIEADVDDAPAVKQSTSANMSSDLVWSIIRKNSCFLIKNQGLTLSKEPGNLTGKNAFKYNGYANAKTVGIDAAADGKGIVLSIRKSKGGNKPAQSLATTTITKGSRAAVKTIKNILSSASYRQDLIDPAIRRTSAILSAQKAGVAKKRRSRRKKL